LTEPAAVRAPTYAQLQQQLAEAQQKIDRLRKKRPHSDDTAPDDASAAGPRDPKIARTDGPKVRTEHLVTLAKMPVVKAEPGVDGMAVVKAEPGVDDVDSDSQHENDDHTLGPH